MSGGGEAVKMLNGFETVVTRLMSGQGVITDKQVVTNHAAANASRWKKMALPDTCDEVEKDDRGCGFHQRVKISIELLTALDWREKEAGIFPEPLVDLFMKATTVKGVDNSLINIQIIHEFGWYPALAQYRLSLHAVSKGREMASFIEDLTWLLLGGADLFSLMNEPVMGAVEQKLRKNGAAMKEG
nr:ABC transporter G family member 29-like isoform X1 [Tanacetum cinerariifolium]